MWRYIVTHWQGEQSLPRSVFLNWLLVYLLLALLAGLSEVSAIRWDAFAWVFLGAMLVWLVWAIVGVVRRGGKILVDRRVSKARKLAAALVILGATAFVVVAASDVYRLFIYARVPTGGGIKAADRPTGGKLAMDFGASGLKMLPVSLLLPNRQMHVPFVKIERP